MKRIALLLFVFLVAVAPVLAQNASDYIQVPKSTSTYGSWSSDPGATWAASAVHDSKIFQTYGFDSVEVMFYVPDTMKVTNVVFYRTLPSVYNYTDSTDFSAAGDTTISAQADLKYYRFGTRITATNLGLWGFIRIYFAAAGNDLNGTEKYKIYVKRFSGVSPNKN